MRIPVLAALALLPIAGSAASPVPIPALAKAPVIDGRIDKDEYKGAYSLALDGLTPNANPGWNPFSDDTVTTSDLSFTFHVGHDDTALYIAFDITDDSISSVHCPRPGMAGASVWDDDCTEVFIDGDFDRDEPSEGSHQGSRSKDNEWAEGMIPHYAVPDGTYWDNGHRLYGNRPDGWFAKTAVISPTHWQVEYRIPFAAIDTKDGPGFQALKVGDTFGLNVMVNDADNGQPRKHQVAWNGKSHDDRLYLQQEAWVEVRAVKSKE